MILWNPEWETSIRWLRSSSASCDSSVYPPVWMRIQRLQFTDDEDAVIECPSPLCNRGGYYTTALTLEWFSITILALRESMTQLPFRRVPHVYLDSFDSVLFVFLLNTLVDASGWGCMLPFCHRWINCLKTTYGESLLTAWLMISFASVCRWVYIPTLHYP